MDTRHAYIQTRIGELLLVASGDALTGVYFEGHWHPPAEGTLGAEVQAAGDPLLREAEAELHEYLAGERTEFEVPVSLHGDAFQMRVWAMLNEIPFAATTTYGTLAARLGDPAMARAVGRAVGRNPVSIIVPCHRVVGADGKLTGYAGGLDRKRFLLTLEEPRVLAAERLF